MSKTQFVSPFSGFHEWVCEKTFCGFFLWALGVQNNRHFLTSFIRTPWLAVGSTNADGVLLGPWVGRNDTIYRSLSKYVQSLKCIRSSLKHVLSLIAADV